MERKKASDFDQELLELFDQYVHGGIDRRGFLDRAGKFAVGGMTAGMLLDALNPKFALARVRSSQFHRAGLPRRHREAAVKNLLPRP